MCISTMTSWSFLSQGPKFNRHSKRTVYIKWITCTGHWWLYVTTMVLYLSTRVCSAQRYPECPTVCRCTFVVTGTVAANHMNCTHARLTSVPASQSQRVESLDLSHNPLGELTDNYFAPHAFLHTLKLRRCGIHTISHGAFNDLHNLHTLDLSGNMLSDLDPAVLSDLPFLADLALGHNKLTAIDEDLLLYNTKLRKLDLQYNKITSLSTKENSKVLHNLESLNLNSNPLKKLPVSFFGQLSSVFDLYLANTQLQTLPAEILITWNQLKVLNLADNFLNIINMTASGPVLSTLQSFNLSGNPINCSCANMEFKQWLDQHPLAWTNDTAAICRYPSALEGKLLHKLPLSDFICDKVGASIGRSVSSKQQEIDEKDQESPYKSKLGPLHYNPKMGWYTAATLTGMLVLFLVCVALDKAKRHFFKWRRARRLRHEKASYASGSLRYSGKGSHNSIDGMDSISMVVIHGHTNNTSFDTDKDSLTQGKTKSNVSHISIGTPPHTNISRAASLRLKYKEKRPDSLSLSTTSQRTYRFPAIAIHTLGNSLEQSETTL